MQTKVQHGVSLVELLFVLAILAILAGVALPATGGLVADARHRNARSALTVALNQARSRAIHAYTHVVACPSSDGLNCSGQTSWHHGWLVFEDSNRNGQLDDDETVLVQQQAQGAGQVIVSNIGRTRIRYRPDGSASGTNATFTFCDRRGAEDASSVVINNAGRIRKGRPTQQGAATACALAAT